MHDLQFRNTTIRPSRILINDYLVEFRVCPLWLAWCKPSCLVSSPVKVPRGSETHCAGFNSCKAEWLSSSIRPNTMGTITICNDRIEKLNWKMNNSFGFGNCRNCSQGLKKICKWSPYFYLSEKCREIPTKYHQKSLYKWQNLLIRINFLKKSFLKYFSSKYFERILLKC